MRDYNSGCKTKYEFRPRRPLIPVCLCVCMCVCVRACVRVRSSSDLLWGWPGSRPWRRPRPSVCWRAGVGSPIVRFEINNLKSDIGLGQIFEQGFSLSFMSYLFRPVILLGACNWLTANLNSASHTGQITCSRWENKLKHPVQTPIF